MPLEGEYEPSSWDWVSDQVTAYERTGGQEANTLRDTGIPVIIVTGISDDFKRFISTRRQVPPPEGYISKPVDHEEFLGMVRDLLG